MQTQAKFESISAAADFMGQGAIETPRYESEIADIVRRNSPTLGRLPQVPATGHPHRYFEQTAVGKGQFTDPRNLTPTSTQSTRQERGVMIKALTNRSDFSLFDTEVTKMQGQFAYAEAKDIQDIVTGVVLTEASAIWQGGDTNLMAPTSLEYMGLLAQITQQDRVELGASIIDTLKSRVATMVSNPNFVIRPTAIYVNGILGDYIDQEAKASKLDLDKVELTAGVVVKAVMTQAGPLPLISDPFLAPSTTAAYGFAAPSTGCKLYFAVILTESWVEMPFVHNGDGNSKPRLFQLGLLAGLQAQYVAVRFAAIVAKGASYAHAVVAVVRP